MKSIVVNVNRKGREIWAYFTQAKGERLAGCGAPAERKKEEKRKERKRRKKKGKEK